MYCIIGVASNAKHRIDTQIRVNGMNGMIFQGRIPRIQNHMFDLISSSDIIMIHPGGIKQTISQEQKNGCMDASQNWGTIQTFPRASVSNAAFLRIGRESRILRHTHMAISL